MRLLNTHNYELQTFIEGRTPRYAILSHRWVDDETLFQDYRKGRNQESARYRKVISTCDFAREVRHQQWLWIDTVCREKKSSAELSEAINSMFSYYREAWECYAYFADVGTLHDGADSIIDNFAQSSWFKRGWTLQELVAPLWIFFCIKDWEIFLTNNAYLETLPKELLWSWGDGGNGADLINKITKIPVDVPHHPPHYSDYSVAQRMSWSSDQRTTRIEDEAYCLLGLLDVNMPLLYGERNRAFVRLQEEILRRSVDESILACTLREYDADFTHQSFIQSGGARWTPLLARSPAALSLAFLTTRVDNVNIPRITVESGLAKLQLSDHDKCYSIGNDTY